MAGEGGRPRLMVVAGPNGSGKTTITERGLAHTWFAGCEYINPDNIARDDFGGWNDPASVLAAANAAQARRESCLAQGRSLAFETVFSGADKPEFIRLCRRAGFFCRLFFVGTSDPTINAARVAKRVMNGGHDVPIAKIIARYFKSVANCAEVAVDVDRLYVYDNSVDDAPPRLLFRAANGRAVRAYADVPPWAAAIMARLR